MNYYYTIAKPACEGEKEQWIKYNDARESTDVWLG